MSRGPILRAGVVLGLLTAAHGAAARSAGLDEARARDAALAEVTAAAIRSTVRLEVDGRAPTATGLAEIYARYGLHPLPLRFEARSMVGAGVIVREDGLVLSNHHVVAGAARVRAHLSDGRVVDATVLASDGRTDIAILDLAGEGYAPAALGDSDRMRPGQQVLAVGHPFEFPFSVSTGVISARGRRHLGDGEIEDYLQTDAALSPGGSGGPLFDVTGALIGINTSIYTGDHAGQVGISFAVPSELAWRIAVELLADGRADRPWFGLVVVDAPGGGAEILRVRPEGPAARAGLAPGDRLLEVDGQPVADADDLKRLLRSRALGAETALRFVRLDETSLCTISATNAEHPTPSDVPLPSDGLEWGGLTLAPLTPARAQIYGVAPGRDAGLLVLAAAPEGPGDAAGLVPGDVILKIQGSPVGDAPSLRAAVGERGVAMVQFWRGAGELVTPVGGLASDYQR